MGQTSFGGDFSIVTGRICAPLLIARDTKQFSPEIPGGLLYVEEVGLLGGGEGLLGGLVGGREGLLGGK